MSRIIAAIPAKHVAEPTMQSAPRTASPGAAGRTASAVASVRLIVAASSRAACPRRVVDGLRRRKIAERVAGEEKHRALRRILAQRAAARRDLGEIGIEGPAEASLPARASASLCGRSSVARRSRPRSTRPAMSGRDRRR